MGDQPQVSLGRAIDQPLARVEAVALAPAAMPTLSVVIVSFNVAYLLRACLQALRDDPSVDHEVIVVDNSSADGSAAMVRDEFPEVRLYESDHNGGYAYANNIGLRHASGRYLLLLNPDTVVPASGLGKLVGFLEAHPDVGVVGPKLVRPDGSLDLACRRSFPSPTISLYRMLGLSRLFPWSRRFARYNLTYLDADQMAEVDSVVGACMLVRREAVERVGLLDEAFFMYGEDLDWAFRIKAAGWKVFYYPGVTVLHHKRASSKQLVGKTTFEFYRAMVLFYRKHYAARTPVLLRWLVFVGILAWGATSYVRRALARPSSLPGRIEG